MNIQVVVAIFLLLLVIAFVMRWLRLRHADAALMLLALGAALDQIEKLIDRVPLVKRQPFQVRYVSLRLEQASVRMVHDFGFVREAAIRLSEACKLANQLRRDVLLLLPPGADE
jgi:hypothetical protein